MPRNHLSRLQFGPARAVRLGSLGQTVEASVLLRREVAQCVGRSFLKLAGRLCRNGSRARIAGDGPGDVMIVDGPLGSRMKTIVNALEKRFPDPAARGCGE